MGNIINSNVIISSNEIMVNGVKYKVPKGFKFNNVSVINGKLSIKGYTLEGDTFVKNSSAIIRKIKSFFKGK